MPINANLRSSSYDSHFCYEENIKIRGKERIEAEAEEESLRKPKEEADKLEEAKNEEEERLQDMAEIMDYTEEAQKLMREAEDLKKCQVSLKGQSKIHSN